jgi:hypothetical protein
MPLSPQRSPSIPWKHGDRGALVFLGIAERRSNPFSSRRRTARPARPCARRRPRDRRRRGRRTCRASLCPSIFCTTFTCAPEGTARLPAVWRRDRVRQRVLLLALPSFELDLPFTSGAFSRTCSRRRRRFESALGEPSPRPIGRRCMRAPRRGPRGSCRARRDLRARNDFPSIVGCADTGESALHDVRRCSDRLADRSIEEDRARHSQPAAAGREGGFRLCGLSSERPTDVAHR